MVLLEFERGQVVETRVRADGVVVLAPGFDKHLRLAPGAKPLDAETLVAEAPVERLVGAVLPRFTRVDDRGLDVRVGEPLEDSAADELRSAIGAQVGGRAVDAHEPSEDSDNAAGPDTASNVESQTFMGELVDDRKALQLLAVGAGVEYEVVRPDVIGSPWRQRSRSAGGQAAVWTFARQPEAGLAPQATSTVDPHGVTFASKEDANAPVAIARVLRRKPCHGRQHRPVLRRPP
jgi:hypothetical protein